MASGYDSFPEPLASRSPDARAYIDYHYIDYHIDWIHTAVELARNPGDGEVRPNDPRVSTGKPEEYAASSPARLPTHFQLPRRSLTEPPASQGSLAPNTRPGSHAKLRASRRLPQGRRWQHRRNRVQ